MTDRLGWKHPNAEVRRLAVQLLSDPAALAQLALGDSEEEVRCVAITRLGSTNRALLRHLLDDDPSEMIRVHAAVQLKHQQALAQLARSKNQDVVRVALEGLEDQTLLAALARDPTIECRWIPVSKLLDKRLLAKLARSDQNEAIQYRARERLQLLQDTLQTEDDPRDPQQGLKSLSSRQHEKQSPRRVKSMGPWALLATLPTGDDEAYVYVLPFDFGEERQASLMSFEELGRSNFVFPQGVKQWYRAKRRTDPFLCASLSWEGDPENTQSLPIKWHPDGYGCAAFKLPFADFTKLRAIVQLRLGPILVAEALSDHANLYHYHSGGHRLVVRAHQIRRVFASYAREDIAIVRLVDSIVRNVANLELRWDLNVLVSGDDWSRTIQREIKTADTFQLFWSENARHSPNVRREWRYAVSLRRKHFVKPIYWTRPMPVPPNELKRINFSFLELPTP